MEISAESVIADLVDAGYRPAPSPVSIGSVPFGRLPLFEGPEDSIDLALVVDVGSQGDPRGTRLLVERISRALDVVASRRPLTVVLAGSSLVLPALEADLMQMCRVVRIDDVSNYSAQLSQMLPLDIGNLAGEMVETEELEKVLGVSKHSDLGRIVQEARLGSKAVENALTTWIDESFVTGEDQS